MTDSPSASPPATPVAARPATTGRPTLSLALDVAETKSAVTVVEPEPDDDRRTYASNQVDQILDVDPNDEVSRTAARDAVDGMGRDLQQRSASRSRMLQAPLKDITQHSDDGGPVARSLSDLRIERPDGPRHRRRVAHAFDRQDPRCRDTTQALLHALRELTDPDRRDRQLAGEGP